MMNRGEMPDAQWLEPPEGLDVYAALRYVLRCLVPKGHAYIVNVCGRREVQQGQAAAVQIIPGAYLGVEGAPGLPWLYDCSEEKYPLDPQALEPYWRPLGWNPPFVQGFDGLFYMVGIPLGADPLAGAALLEAAMRQGYGYGMGEQFICTVHDEGPIGPTDVPRRAPPGGCCA